jgi:hypothetical protein
VQNKKVISFNTILELFLEPIKALQRSCTLSLNYVLFDPELKFV